MKRDTADPPERIVQEFVGADLGDERRSDRLVQIAQTWAAAPSKPFAQLFASAAEEEGLHRFLANPAIEAEEVLYPHLSASGQRVRQEKGRVLLVHDTTALKFPHLKPSELGYLNTGKAGLYGHLTLALSGEGQERVLGVVGWKLWGRKRPRRHRKKHRSGAAYARDKKKESQRWFQGVEESVTALEAGYGPQPKRVPLIHLMDTEADSYELFSALLACQHRFVIRLGVDRKVIAPDRGDAAVLQSLEEAFAGVEAVATRTIDVSRRQAKTAPRQRRYHPPRQRRLAQVQIAAKTVELRRPDYLKAPHPERRRLNVVRVWEAHPPKGEKPIEWWLITTEPIDTVEQIEAVVDTYCARWVVEEFFKALKSGGKVQQRRVAAKRIARMLAVALPIAWQMLALRTQGRTHPQAPATTVLRERQVEVLRAVAPRPLSEQPTVQEALRAVAALGGHRPRNGEPGWLVLMRGMESLRLTEQGWIAAHRHLRDAPAAVT